MPLVTSKEMLLKAQQGGYAVGAFNAENMEMVKAIIAAAEELKINIGSAVPRLEEIAMEVTGRNLITGLPKTMKISSTEIYEALKDPISELIEAIQAVIERTPPQLASDIFNDGIVFTGGAAALTGLCEAVYAVMKIPCGVADDPQTCVVMGCGRALEDYSALRHLLGNGRGR